MTPERKRALQWFHDRGEVKWFAYADNPPSKIMRDKMIKDGQLEGVSTGEWKPMAFRLTDKGRRMLHGDAK